MISKELDRYLQVYGLTQTQLKKLEENNKRYFDECKNCMKYGYFHSALIYLFMIRFNLFIIKKYG